MTPAFAKEALGDMRDTLPADAFVMQPVSGLGITEVTYGVSSTFGFWNQIQSFYLRGWKTGNQLACMSMLY